MLGPPVAIAEAQDVKLGDKDHGVVAVEGRNINVFDTNLCQIETSFVNLQAERTDCQLIQDSSRYSRREG